MNNSYINKDCPALMSDGRHITDYRPSCELHSCVRKENRLMDNNMYRKYMIDNADRMMEGNRQYWISQRSCGSCNFVHPDPSNQDTFWAKYKKQLWGELNKCPK